MTHEIKKYQPKGFGSYDFFAIKTKLKNVMLDGSSARREVRGNELIWRGICDAWWQELSAGVNFKNVF